jgi:hypothetical protein
MFCLWHKYTFSFDVLTMSCYLLTLPVPTLYFFCFRVSRSHAYLWCLYFVGVAINRTSRRWYKKSQCRETTYYSQTHD